MKPIFFILLIGMPFLGFGQVVDTIKARKEVDSLLQLNQKLVGEQKFEEAMQVIETAKQKSKDVFGKNSALFATCTFNHGRTFFIMGNYTEAEPLYLESKDIREQVFGKEHQDYAASLNNLALLYADKGNYIEAEPMYLEAINIRARTLGKEHPNYAMSLNSLGSLYWAKAEYEKAEPLFLQAKEIWGKVLGKDHPYYAAALNNLAALYLEKGDYEKSEILLWETKTIYATALGKDHPDYASALSALAALYSMKYDYAKAEPLYLEAINIQAKSLGKEHPDYANSLKNLASLYLEKGDYPKSESLYLETMAIEEKTVGKEHPNYATSLNNLGMVYRSSRSYNKAELLFLESQRINAKIFGENHPTYAQALSNLGVLFYDQGDFDKAESFFLKAKGIRAAALGKDHSDYALTVQNLTQVYLATKRIPKSTVFLLELRELNLRLIQKSAAYSSESQMQAYIHEFDKDIAQLYSFSQAHPNPKLSCANFDNTLFFSGYLLENARRLTTSIARGDSLTRETFKNWKGSRRRLANEYAKPVADRRFLAEAEAQAEIYEKTLTRNLPTFIEALRPPIWQNVRDHLRTGEAALELISYRYYTPHPTDSVMYAALVLLPSDTAPHFIPLFEERQLKALLNRPGISEKLVLKELYGNSPELHRLLWGPLEPLLRDVKTIYYSPSGLLHRLNPAALLDESNQTLSEGRQWVRVGSTRELVTGRLADQSYARAPEGNADITLTAMVYGGITYDMDSLAFTAANPTAVMDSTENPSRKDGAFNYIITEQPSAKTSGTRGNPDGTWGALTATGQEADQVSAMLKSAGFHTKKQKGFSASEEQVKQIGVGKPSPRILHIATHGFSYPDPKKEPPKGFGDSEPTYKMLDDPMLRSGLVLAGANYYWKNKRPLTNREDGVLVAYEVRDLNLRNTELAVLSACQTGLGDVVGSEGVYGLQRAFRIAGVKFLIVSLWEVPDEQTQELMRLFYQNWLEKKESLRDAFNHAQQRMREKEPNPYLWAGFVLVE